MSDVGPADLRQIPRRLDVAIFAGSFIASVAAMAALTPPSPSYLDVAVAAVVGLVICLLPLPISEFLYRRLKNS